MAEKTDHEEFSHVCKLCNRRFPSGKSLGGHMRSHVISSSYNADRPQLVSGGGDLGGAAGYGLRENPRKTWRAAAVNLKQERVCVCKRCGKAFQSLKALCGHMSCHSYKDRSFSRFNGYDDEEEDDADSWGSEEEDEEEQGKVFGSFNFGNGSSSNVSGIENEQEEVAICLMMLSRDLGQKFGGNLGAESSDNNSVILEGGSRLSTSNYASVKKKQDLKMENSDSGYFLNGAKDLDSDDSVDGYAKNHGFKKHKPKFELGFKFNADVCDPKEKHKRMKISIARNVNWCKKPKGHKCPFCPKVFGSGQALGGHKRSHLIGCSAEDKAYLMRSVSGSRDSLIDLNLPAPGEEDGAGGEEIMPW